MKTAFLFPGQGSQALGMLSESADAVAGTFEEASEALGYDLWSLIQQGPVEQLNQTEFTQPALLTVSVALFYHDLGHVFADFDNDSDYLGKHHIGDHVASGGNDFTFEGAVMRVRLAGTFGSCWCVRSCRDGGFGEGGVADVGH